MLNFLYRLHCNSGQWHEYYIGWQEPLSSIIGTDVSIVSFGNLMKFNFVGAAGPKHTENPSNFDKEPNYDLNHLIPGS